MTSNEPPVREISAVFCVNTLLIPHVILGDFDSLAKSSQVKLRKYPSKWIRFNREKDESDSELALEYAISHGYKNLLIFGLLGSRLDHMLSNIFKLETLLARDVKALFVEGNQEIQLITKHHVFDGKIGEMLSLIPLKGTASGVTTKGLKYPLLHEDLLFGYARGISNVFTQKTAEISLTGGSLLVIHTKNK